MKPSVCGIYHDQTTLALTTSFQKISLNFDMKKLLLWNDEGVGGHDIIIGIEEYTGRPLLKLKAGESIAIDALMTRTLMIKGSAGGESYRLTIM